MSDIAALVADNLDIWTGAIERKGGAGRGGGGKRISLYGIERLRALILDLAVRGKLVDQNVEDQPARELLSEIRAVKPKYLLDHGLPKSRTQVGVIEQAPFELPTNWAWARLGDIAAYMQRGKSPKYSEGSGIYVVSQRCVQWAGLDLSVAKEISRSSLDSYEPYRFLRSGDLLWNSTGTGTIGRVIALSDVPDCLVCDSHVTLVRCPWVNARYLQCWLASDDVYGQIEVLAAGSTNQIEWTAQLAASQIVPLPPLAEQCRIVAKVDELMALCDALERESADALTAHQMLAETLLATLVNSSDAADLAANWARLESHFDTFFTTETSIDALKQTILDLAVRGKLVEQEAGDENASVLIRKIAIQREALVNAGEAKRLGKSKSRTVPYIVPAGWQWTQLGAISQLVTKGSSPKWQGVSYTDSSHGLLFITSENVGNFNLRKLNELKYVEARFSEIEPRSMLKKHDILINLVGASIGRTAIYDLDEEANINQAVALVRLVDARFGPDSRYLLMFLNSATAISEMLGSRVISAQPNISLADVSSFPIPIPPIAEQHRIVAKVDELMALCDVLKARLSDAAETRRNLADAIVERAAA